MGFSPVTGRALVSYGYFADGVFVMSEQEDGSWRNSQAAKASHPCNTTLTFAPDDGAPVVAYSCGLAGPLGFAKYDGARWVDFPRTHGGIWSDYGFAFSGSDEPLIAYNADIGGNDGFFLDAYKNGGWQTLSSYDYGRLNFGGGVDLVADSEGYHIAYKSWNNGVYYAFAIPEPSSVLLMITGSLILLRRNKGQR